MIPRIFFSCPSLLSPNQVMAARLWNHSLQRMGIEPIPPLSGNVGDALWRTLRRKVESADGALILGLRQLRMDEGRWRPDTIASLEPAKWWPTPWNHVEAGMAIMAGLPVLVIREAGVSGGVFDPCVWTNGVYGAELNSPSIEPTAMAWASDVFARHRMRTSGKRSPVGSIQRNRA
jgi:hypothetical protein